MVKHNRRENFRPQDERASTADLSPVEKQKVTAAAAKQERLEPGPHGDLNPPEGQDFHGFGTDGLSDSQHESSDELD
jgi:hypothetical protein